MNASFAAEIKILSRSVNRVEVYLAANENNVISRNLFIHSKTIFLWRDKPLALSAVSEQQRLFHPSRLSLSHMLVFSFIHFYHRSQAILICLYYFNHSDMQRIHKNYSSVVKCYCRCKRDHYFKPVFLQTFYIFFYIFRYIANMIWCS